MNWSWLTGKRPQQPTPYSPASLGVLDIVGAVSPAPPALKQEQFADNHAAVAAAEARVRTVYRQVVATNNSAVDRTEAPGKTTDYTRALSAQDETALTELPATAAELKQLQIAVVVQPQPNVPNFYQPE